MLETILLYNVLLLFCYLLARYLDDEPKYVKLSLFFMTFALSFVCGFRSYNIGIDTHTYFNMLDKPEASLSMEYGFRLLCKVLLSIRLSKELVIFTISLITNTLFVVRLYTLRTIAPMRHSVPVYFVMVYFLTFSGIRQMLAVSIAFFATYYIFQKKKLISFIVLVLLAAFFHTSALIAFLFLLIEVLDKNSRKKWAILKLILLFASPFLISYGYTVLNKNYGYYFENSARETANIGLMVFLRLILLLLIVITFYAHWRAESDEQKSFIKKLLVIEFVAVSISGLDYFFANISRISWYFLVFTPVLYAYVLRHKASKMESLFAKFMIWICVGYTYVSMFLSQTNQLVPYEFFWNV